ncbi:hypothetical protein BJY04DRAFT_33313 [Aspergillus karnatakaensis]|uniref:uncharacterized protein n=1 Tax=Aspergillus karnatakaensis TaxID=1810916 RepID=UPI003CCE2CF0
MFMWYGFGVSVRLTLPAAGFAISEVDWFVNGKSNVPLVASGVESVTSFLVSRVTCKRGIVDLHLSLTLRFPAVTLAFDQT